MYWSIEGPETNRGRGATLQKYKDGGLSGAGAHVCEETSKLGEQKTGSD